MGRKKLIENREEVILAAAMQLFRRFGFDKTTMDDIAQEAGIAKGSIYLDFPSKNDILMSLVHRMMQTRLAEIKATLENTPNETPRLDVLKQILTTHAMTVYNNVQESALDPEVLAQTRIFIKEKFQAFFMAMRQTMANLIQEAMDRGEMPKGDSARQAIVFMIGFSAIMPPYHTSIPREQHLDNIEDLLSLLIAGLKQGIQPKGVLACTGTP